MTSWQATVKFIGQMTEDAAFDLLEALGQFGAAVGTEYDFTGGTVTLSVEADSTLTAAEEASRLVSEATSGPITIIGLEVITEAEADTRLKEPTFPEVVSFAEIGQMAGVSRQRARQLSGNSTFPRAVITTAQGPLFALHAVERWLETRNTRPGRPTTAAV